MKVWILIISMRIVTEDGALNDIQIEMIDGFTSEERCTAAGKKLAIQTLIETSGHIKSHGISEYKNAPSVNHKCIEVIK